MKSMKTKAMQSPFTVYCPRPHVILAALVSFHYSLHVYITRDRASSHTRAPFATPLSLEYEVIINVSVLWRLM